MGVLKKLMVCLGLLLAWTSAASGKVLEQRKYVIDQQKPYAPVTIVDKEKPVTAVFMKDPVQPGKAAAVLVQPVAKPAPEVKKVARSSRGKLRFNSLVIGGRTAKPRVEFERNYLPVGRSDEPVQAEFYEKVFEAIAADDF